MEKLTIITGQNFMKIFELLNQLADQRKIDQGADTGSPTRFLATSKNLEDLLIMLYPDEKVTIVKHLIDSIVLAGSEKEEQF